MAARAPPRDPPPPPHQKIMPPDKNEILLPSARHVEGRGTSIFVFELLLSSSREKTHQRARTRNLEVVARYPNFFLASDPPNPRYRSRPPLSRGQGGIRARRASGARNRRQDPTRARRPRRPPRAPQWRATTPARRVGHVDVHRVPQGRGVVDGRVPLLERHAGHGGVLMPDRQQRPARETAEAGRRGTAVLRAGTKSGKPPVRCRRSEKGPPIWVGGGGGGGFGSGVNL